MKIFIPMICLSVVLSGVRSAPQLLSATQRPIAILSESSVHDLDGNYRWQYETENGILAEETGTLKKADSPDKNDAVIAKGSYSYTSPEGELVQISYTADDNGGFVAQGSHIPTPPPVPAEIQEALRIILSTPPELRQSGQYKP